MRASISKPVPLENKKSSINIFAPEKSLESNGRLGENRRAAFRINMEQFDEQSVSSSHKSPVNNGHSFLTDSSLSVPHGLRFRTCSLETQHSKEKTNIDKIDHIEHRLMGLPGSLTLDLQTSHKYFGTNARTQFFERHQWLNRQRNNTNTILDEQLSRLYFNNEKETEWSHVPFGPIRQQHHFNKSDRTDDEQSQNTFSSRFKQRSDLSYQNETVMLMDSAERSGELFHLLDSDNHDGLYCFVSNGFLFNLQLFCR
jgi:hypothetical protein